MKTIRFVVLVLALLLVPASGVFAQRTMKGQIFIDASGGWKPGATIGAGGYLIPGYWCAGVEGMLLSRRLAQAGSVMTGRLDVYHAGAHGGFMYRFVGTRSRAVNLYGGGEAWLGLESVDPFGRLPEDVVLSIADGTTFVFGVTPRLEAEFFLGRRVALTLGGRLPLTFMSRMGILSYQGTAGIRILL